MMVNEAPVIGWRWTPAKRLLLPSDQLFEDGDLFCCVADKQIPIEDEDIIRQTVQEFCCHLPGCHQVFTSISSYEAHYHSKHYNRCTVCGRSFPSNHLLHIHILESHDSMFLVKATREDSYQCLVESCPIKFSSNATRKDHLVRAHHYPPGFRFHRTNRQPRSAMNSMEVDIPTIQAASSELTSSGKRVFSHKVPPRISFGQGAQRGFIRPKRPKRGGKHWHQNLGRGHQESRVDITDVDMSALASALDTT